MIDMTRSTDSDVPTHSASWPNAVGLMLEARNIDSRKLFDQADIPFNFVTDPSTRVETRNTGTLFELAVKSTNDPCLGLCLPQFVTPGTLHALGYALFASSTLLEFCQRLVSYYSLISDNFGHSLEEQDDAYCLEVKPLNTQVGYESADALMACIYTFCCTLYRPSFRPLRVTCMRPEPKNGRQRFGEFFRSPVSFSESKNAIYFAKSDMLYALPTANVELARRNDELVIEYMAKLQKNNIVRQVEAIIIELMQTGEVSKDMVAERLHVGPRTLQYKLAKQGCSYRDVFDNLRKNLACQYIRQNNLPLVQISYELGFSDVSNFSRAFRHWTGLSPRAYLAANK